MKSNGENHMKTLYILTYNAMNKVFQLMFQSFGEITTHRLHDMLKSIIEVEQRLIEPTYDK